MNKNIVFDLEQIKAVERLLDIVANDGVIDLKITDIQNFLKHGKKLIYKTATINETTKEAIEISGLLCDELRRAHKYIIMIESGNNMSLKDIDTIAATFKDFEERSCFAFGTGIDEFRTDFLIELFIIE